ncbi:MAG TPA: hypothetical protein VGR89_10055, partial [Puia sp.]|nr:hypothetical protein [Puia sp.]
TIVSKANFLLLDEPTNHLDMHSCELLIEALNKYEGSYLLVSHDRYFISKTANKIWEIDNRQIREFKGSYEEWVDWKERNVASALALASAGLASRNAGPAATASPKASPDTSLRPSPKAPHTPSSPPSAEPSPALSSDLSGKPPSPAVDSVKPSPRAPINKEIKKELHRQQRLFQEIEEKMAALTRQKAQLEASLADPSTYSDKEKFLKAEAEYQRVVDGLDKANRQYEEVFDKIVQLEKML